MPNKKMNDPKQKAARQAIHKYRFVIETLLNALPGQSDPYRAIDSMAMSLEELNSSTMGQSGNTQQNLLNGLAELKKIKLLAKNYSLQADDVQGLMGLVAIAAEINLPERGAASLVPGGR